VASKNTRCGRLLTVLELLKEKRRVGENEVLAVTDDVQAAKDVMRLLETLRFAERGGGNLVATPLIDLEVTPQRMMAMEEYIFGREEANEYRMLLAFFGFQVSHRTETTPLVEGVEKPKKAETSDPEVVKRFAKAFIDVSDIQTKQVGRDPKVGGK